MCASDAIASRTRELKANPSGHMHRSLHRLAYGTHHTSYAVSARFDRVLDWTIKDHPTALHSIPYTLASLARAYNNLDE
jgi:hypothetical protein